MTNRIRNLLAALAIAALAVVGIGPQRIARATTTGLSAVISGGLYNGTPSAAGFVALGNGAFQLDASSAWTSLTNGASGISQIETTTNKQNVFVVDFLQSVQSYTEWASILPERYNGSTVTATVTWIANSASTNAVVWGVACLVANDNVAIDSAYGTAVEVTDANQGTNVVNVSAATAAITCAGTSPAPGKRVKWRAYRLGSGADTLAATARLLSVKINYTRAAIP